MMMPPMMPPELMPGMLFYCNVLLILAKFILPSSWEHAGRRFVQSPAFTVAACLCILVALASFSFQYPGHVEQELGLQEGQVSGFFNSVGLGINKGKHYAIWMFWKFWAGLLYIPLLLPIIFSRHLSYVSYLMVSGHTVLVFLFQVAHESVLNAWLYVTEIHYEHWFVVFSYLISALCLVLSTGYAYTKSVSAAVCATITTVTFLFMWDQVQAQHLWFAFPVPILYALQGIQSRVLNTIACSCFFVALCLIGDFVAVPESSQPADMLQSQFPKTFLFALFLAFACRFIAPDAALMRFFRFTCLLSFVLMLLQPALLPPHGVVAVLAGFQACGLHASLCPPEPNLRRHRARRRG